MITSTKSVKTILICHIAMGAFGALSSAAAGFGTIGTDLGLHPANNNAGFIFGYTCFWPIAFGLWTWANCYALSKLNKLRNQALALRTDSKN